MKQYQIDINDQIDLGLLIRQTSSAYEFEQNLISNRPNPRDKLNLDYTIIKTLYEYSRFWMKENPQLTLID